MTDGNDNAFCSGNPEVDGCIGLTKREYFAAMALQGLLANAKYDPNEYFVSLVGVWAVCYADKLIEALNKEKP